MRGAGRSEDNPSARPPRPDRRSNALAAPAVRAGTVSVQTTALDRNSGMSAAARRSGAAGGTSGAGA